MTVDAIYLETTALGFAACVGLRSEPPTAADLELHRGVREALGEAALRFAAAAGSLDAADRAELHALRRFRDGVVSLRGELANGQTSDGEGHQHQREPSARSRDHRRPARGLVPADRSGVVKAVIEELRHVYGVPRHLLEAIAARINGLEDIANRAASLLEAGSDKAARREWAEGIRAEIAEAGR